MSQTTAKRGRRRHTKQEKNLNREITEWVISIIIAVALALVVHNYVFQIVRVDGHSMEPTLQHNERMAVTKFSYLFGDPQRGDIVVTKYPGDNKNYVKRVIALGGETISIKSGVLYINGETLDEPYIKNTIIEEFTETTIPEGYYIVMGDNRNNSRDSRANSVGPLGEDMIIGKSQFVVWPFNEIRSINHYSGILQ
ncbi:MAG: signal peptidase I [Clostridiales bacterium]|nr:signal peptidase I [Clostridiales bacterium]